MSYKRISPTPVIEGGTGALTLTGVLTGNGTSAVTANAVTQHYALIAGASNAVSAVAPSATSGVPFISQGAAADPAFGTAVVAGGGTGNATYAAYGVITAGTTATGAFQQVSGTGSLNQVLVSQGASALPIWAAVPATAGVTAIAGTVNQWDVSASTGSVIGSLPSVLVAPGSIASTTTLAAGNLTTAGIVYNSVTTGILTSHQATNHNVQIGNSSGQLGDVAPSATSGVPLISQGAAADPTFGTASIAGGGTNATSMANTYGVNYFDGTSIVTTAVGTATHVLTSNGVGLAPTFQAAAGGVTSVNGTVNQINSSNTGSGSTTLSLSSTLIAPGSVEVTTTITGDLGDITATAGNINVGNRTAATTAPFVNFKKSRTGGVITTGDILGEVAFTGHDGTGYITSSRIVATSSGTIATNRVASKLDVYTHADSTAAAVLRATFNAAGGLTVTAPDTGAASTLNLSTNAGNVALALAGDRFITASDGVNCFVGNECGTTNASGSNNSAFGYQSLSALTSGARNTGIGKFSLALLTTGNNNTCIGVPSTGTFPGSGSTYTGGESNNLCIVNNGVLGESNKIRIGNTTDHNACFIAGTYNIAVGATAGVLLADSTFQIGSISGAAGTVLVGGTKPAWSALSGLAVTAIAGTANQITASASVGSVTLSTPTTFTAPGYVKATTVFNTATATSSTEAQYQINGTAVLHNYGTDNLWVGAGAGTFTAGGSKNVAVGPLAGAALGANAGINNVYVGYKAGTADTGSGSGNDSGNVGIGKEALGAYTGATNANNTAVGTQSLDQITTGKRNVMYGWEAGHNLTTNDSDNLFIGWSVVGSAGNNNVLRIGGGTGTGSGQQNSCFVSGIQGITVTGTAVLVSASDQLGIAVSSRRYKENIQDMDDYSSPLMKLRPVTFTYIENEDKMLQPGLIAEEVAEVMPSLVVNDKEGKPQTVKYHDMASLLLNEIQKLNARIAILEARG